VSRAGSASEGDGDRLRSLSPLRLVAVSTQFLLVAPVRLALGLGGLALARVAEELEPDVVLVLFLLGAAGMVVALVADPRRRFPGPEIEEGQPPGARLASRGRALVDALLPSTVTVAVLAAVTAAFDARLTAVLAGVLVGMGAASLATGASLAWRERVGGFRLYAEPGGRRYYVNRGS
jgi:hypothetical protein